MRQKPTPLEWVIVLGLSATFFLGIELAIREQASGVYVEHHPEYVDGEPQQVAIGASPVHPRSPKWPAFRRKMLDKLGWKCAACSSTLDLNLHHKHSFHTNPELELDEHNVIVLCRGCHLRLGHDADGPDGPRNPNWKDSNPNVEMDVERVRAKLNPR